MDVMVKTKVPVLTTEASECSPCLAIHFRSFEAQKRNFWNACFVCFACLVMAGFPYECFALFFFKFISDNCHQKFVTPSSKFERKEQVLLVPSRNALRFFCVTTVNDCTLPRCFCEVLTSSAKV